MEERVPCNRPVAVQESIQSEDMRRVRDRVRVIEPCVWNSLYQAQVDVALVREKVPGGPKTQEEREAYKENGHRIQSEGRDSDALVEERIPARSGINTDW